MVFFTFEQTYFVFLNCRKLVPETRGAGLFWLEMAPKFPNFHFLPVLRSLERPF